jgi:hypothetical protein
MATSITSPASEVTVSGEKESVMTVPTWLKVVGSFLVGLIGAIVAILLTRRQEPTQADALVTSADAEKKRIADEIAADSAQGLVDAFNNAVKKEKP